MNNYDAIRGWWATECGKLVNICNYLSTSNQYKYVGKLKFSYNGEESMHTFNQEGLSSDKKYRLKERINENDKIKLHSFENIDYVKSWKVNTPLIIWHGSLENSEVLHFKGVKHQGGYPVIYCFENGTTSYTVDRSKKEPFWYCGTNVYYNNGVIDLTYIKDYISDTFPPQPILDWLKF